MVSEEWAMPRMRVWGEWLNRDSSARLRVVVDGVGACFGLRIFGGCRRVLVSRNS
jgi:hypothetical protein